MIFAMGLQILQRICQVAALRWGITIVQQASLSEFSKRIKESPRFFRLWHTFCFFRIATLMLLTARNPATSLLERNASSWMLFSEDMDAP